MNFLELKNETEEIRIYAILKQYISVTSYKKKYKNIGVTSFKILFHQIRNIVNFK